MPVMPAGILTEAATAAACVDRSSTSGDADTPAGAA